jgi:SAM-dependent methyltransferase
VKVDKSKKIKDFWQNRATKFDIADNAITHNDVWQRWLEIEMIKKFCRKSFRVLDMGCGNGYSTRRIAPLVKEIIGIDYSEDMVKRAISESQAEALASNRNIKFAIKDALKLKAPDFGLFDLVISERCLINLHSWEAQKKAIINIASVIKPGGRFVFVEGKKEGRAALNKLRLGHGLKVMPTVWHNIDFAEKKTLIFLSRYFRLEQKINFGVYDFVSRIVHPLLVTPQEPDYDSRINEIAAKLTLNLQDFERISRVLFLVLKKK